jgi:uncharacterized protein YecT (DUF1311 family)
MRRRFAGAAGLGLMLLAGAAQAAGACKLDAISTCYTPAYNACMKTALSTLQMVGCASDEHDVQDKRLNAAYQKIVKDLTPHQKAGFAAAERAWIAFRDAHCASMEDEEWGSLSKVAAARCLVDATIARERQLEDYPPAD